MTFQEGVRGWQYFPQTDSMLDMCYIVPKQVLEPLRKLSYMNYFENDGESIQRDLRILSECDNHARETNDFYNGGQLQNKMTEWSRLGNDLKSLKQGINLSKVSTDIKSYNDNLERAKLEYLLSEFKKACANFNSAYHVKEKEYYTYNYYWVGNTQYCETIYHPPVYWEITGYDWYNYKMLRSLESKIKTMESQSGYSIPIPSNWERRVKANGKS